MSGSVGDLARLIHSSAKNSATDREAQPDQLFWAFQIIRSDVASRLALWVEHFRSLAESAPRHCNPDFGKQLQEVLMRFVREYKNSIRASSSQGGDLIKLINQETKTTNYNVMNKTGQKAQGILQKLGIGQAPPPPSGP